MSGCPPEQPVSRPFPAEVRGPGGERRIVYVTKRYDDTRGEWLTDAEGNEYAARVGGGIEPVTPAPPAFSAAAAKAAAPASSPAVSAERYPAEGGEPFRIAVHRSSGIPDSVLVHRHFNPRGTSVYVAADGSGRLFAPRGNGLSGAVEVGG